MTNKDKLVAIMLKARISRYKAEEAKREAEEAERKLQEIQRFGLELLIDRARDVIDRFDQLDSDDFYLPRPRWKDLSRLAPSLRKAKRRAEAEQRSLGQANENRQWKSERTKKAALVIANELIQKNPRLGMSRRTSQLADLVSKRLKQQDIIKTPRTIRGWLAEASRK